MIDRLTLIGLSDAAPPLPRAEARTLLTRLARRLAFESCQ